MYLKVKLRKDGTVSRSEYADLRDRIQTLRSRARGESTTQEGSGVPRASRVGPKARAAAARPRRR